MIGTPQLTNHSLSLYREQTKHPTPLTNAKLTSRMNPQMPTLNYYEAIGLLFISGTVVQLTDVGNDKRVSLLHNINFPYLVILSLSSFSPWMIYRACSLAGLITTENPSYKQNQEVHSMSRRRRFTIHELIHNTAGFFHHLVPFSIFVWIAMINFPLWFAQMDSAMLKRDSRGKSPKDRNLVKHHPLFIVSLVAYVVGSILRGESYILSAAGIVTLALSFVRRNVPTQVAVNIIPLGLLFVIEHHSVIYEKEYCHFIHFISHFALHKATDDIYTHYIR